jgi:hypothetical protein
MIRFYLIASALVIGGGFVAVRSIRSTTYPALDVSSQAGATLPPKPAIEATSTAPSRPFSGEAPWALAALPACFEQTERVDGPPAFVDARLPKSARLLADGATVQAHDCTLREHAGGVTIERGNDRFAVPGEVRIYRNGPQAVLTYRERGQLAELRMYRILP